MRTPEGFAREVWQAVADSVHRDDQSAYDAMADLIRARDAEAAEAAQAENARLRAGIEALVDDPRQHESDHDGDGACVDAEALNDLLNPPTKGGTDYE